MTRTDVVARGQARAAESREKPRRGPVAAAGGAPGGSGRGTRRISICQGNPLPWVHAEARLKHRCWGSTLGSQTKRRSSEMPETTPRTVEKRAGTCWRSPRSWSSPEQGPALFSLGPENREEFRQKSKGEKLPGLFYEVILTLITKPVKNSTY